MNFIAHRINSVEQLKDVPMHLGVELDLRDHKDGRIIIHHDPFTEGECFEEYLKQYKHGTIILNVKSERIEHKVLELIKKYNIKDYFFLDSSFPMIFNLVQNGEHNIALRYSEYESLESVLLMQNKVKWVWVDCFTKLPIDKNSYQTLKEAGFKLCLVSPELQGRPEDIPNYKKNLEKENIVFDAICTKLHNIKLWS
ncbi:hypothetical protein RAC89_14645 [Paenibacillus sp. GD4]|uniref:hypothetical protein n=1 Tax=Paenibacillus sp. GD4 TaxID=3068890 RepID=UPI002796C2DC|nr:hypothetical protein [Paenibacillus sp. GD4]MDQ1911646.1 hypothetical protein [Paenibacillus sp. GD4]